MQQKGLNLKLQTDHSYRVIRPQVCYYLINWPLFLFFIITSVVPTAQWHGSDCIFNFCNFNFCTFAFFCVKTQLLPFARCALVVILTFYFLPIAFFSYFDFFICNCENEMKFCSYFCSNKNKNPPCNHYHGYCSGNGSKGSNC